MADHEALALQLLEFVPNATPEQAREYLAAHNWDLDSAAASLMADLDEAGDEVEASAAAPTSATQPAPPEYTGPRTLDGRPAPQSATASASKPSKPQQKKKGLATLSSLGGGGHSHDHDHDDDGEEDEDDERGPRDTYAGGEKSGLALQDPNKRSADSRKIINDLLKQAKSQRERPEADEPAGPSTSSFHGAGQTLGGEGTPSRAIPDPRGPAASQPAANAPVQERTLHLWRDGFSIDDGPLLRFDDPANADAMRMIQAGRAPVHLMNVRYDEPLDVKLAQHDEDWRQLPQVYKPFGGEGRRLGSPVPGEASMSAPVVPAAPSNLATSTPAAASASSSAPAVDDSQPTVMIRVQLPDGSRLPARFNTTHTVGDIYDFIANASADLRGNQGSWVLATTFPNKDHTDKSLVLGETAEFKKGGTAVVKRISS